MDYCAEHDDDPWNLDKKGLESVMEEALAIKAGYSVLDGYYSMLNLGRLISQLMESPIEKEVYTPTEKEIIAYCEKYGINPESLNHEELNTVKGELCDIHKGKAPFSSILFWMSDKPLSALFAMMKN